MGKALAQLFAMFTTLFMALESMAKTILNIATVGEEMSASYVDQSRIDRAKQQLTLNRELEAERKLITP